MGRRERERREGRGGDRLEGGVEDRVRRGTVQYVLYVSVLHTACTSLGTIPFSVPQPTETVEGGPFHNPDMCVS